MNDWISRRQMVDKIQDLFLDKYEAKANSDLTGFFKEVLKILVNDKGQPWISVKDRLPDDIKDVIVNDEFGSVYPAYYYTFDECWMYSFTAERCNHKITHWTPLPEPNRQRRTTMDSENKKGFVSALEEALILYSREKIAKINYDPHNEAWGGLETLDIHFSGEHRKVIDVTGDSCIAIMRDLWEALQ